MMVKIRSAFSILSAPFANDPTEVMAKCHVNEVKVLYLHEVIAYSGSDLCAEQLSVHACLWDTFVCVCVCGDSTGHDPGMKVGIKFQFF